MKSASTLGLLLALLPSWASAEPLYLDVTGSNVAATALRVMAGAKAGLTLTLTASEPVEPQLSADMVLVGGPLAAPVFTGTAIALSRMGNAQAGVQRFNFNVDIPAVERRADLVLRLRVRVDPTKGWLPLPVVRLEVAPRSWNQVLQQFTKHIPSGRLSGGERLARLFEVAGVAVPEIPPGGGAEVTGVQVWFAEAGTDGVSLPESPTAGLWIVFKKDLRGGIELGRIGPQGSLCVLVDEQALASVEDNASAQNLLERALALAHTLTASESVLSSP